MKHIRDLYKNSEAAIPKNDWMQKLINLMKKLNWSDSVYYLPEGKRIQNENVLLLWNNCEALFELYMSEPSKEGRQLRSRDRQQT